MSKYTALFAATAALMATAVLPAAHAQDSAASPVRLIVPYVPGGSTDTVARLIAPAISKELGVPVVVENRGGANGTIGLQAVARAAADGTVFGITDSAFVVSPSLVKTLPYDTRKDFKAVVLVAASPQVLTVNPDVPVKSVKDLVALAKQSPGKYSFASAGGGTAIHIAGEQLKLAAGIDLLHVPYRGLGPALIDVMGGQVTLVFGGPHTTKQQVAAGKLRALAITGPHRSPAMPEVMTFAEAGYPGVDMVTTNGIVAPAGTPDAIISRVNRAVVNALATDAELKRHFDELGLEPLGGTPEAFTTWIDTQLDKWQQLVQAAGIQVD
ncbi:Bug family tripartite tricarboxylate transporter substrate binding protein [Pollutimonas bauzanensis]|uniref:Tripartite-type tricarboxylate transporter, receptor component TctC n=1 Tax=Pollutimonas bauzanensis TaxID=658167 RepID=A0A1M5X8Z4_9BURK|nr:tripartite tricarboxylate transporter substrate binding protein [Pollutimonas bauzanensis]SHH95683.1 Tripartite-type tricarboxylate transporter, receptor component TctC [Pollutimonas bauzanensis]